MDSERKYWPTKDLHSTQKDENNMYWNSDRHRSNRPPSPSASGISSKMEVPTSKILKDGVGLGGIEERLGSKWEKSVDEMERKNRRMGTCSGVFRGGFDPGNKRDWDRQAEVYHSRRYDVVSLGDGREVVVGKGMGFDLSSMRFVKAEEVKEDGGKGDGRVEGMGESGKVENQERD